MGIDLGRSDGSMPQHFLDGPQVGATFNQVRGEGMPEGMRTDGLPDTRFFCQVFYNVKDHDPAKLLSPAIQENKIFMAPLDFNVASDLVLVPF